MRLLCCLIAILGSLLSLSRGEPDGPILRVARDIPHPLFTQLLGNHRDATGRIDYAAWRKDPAALAALDLYLASFNRSEGPADEGGGQMASWINLYHACLIHEILRQPGLASPKGDPGFFHQRRHHLGNISFSLEDLSEKHIFPLLGWRTRGVLHLGCYGGPPLPLRALEQSTLDTLIDANWKTWLGSPDHFQASAKVIRLSPVFLWHRDEFEVDGGYRKILGRYLPSEAATYVEQKDIRVEYLPFDWTLSAVGNPARTYTLGRMLRDRWWPW